MKKVIVIVAAIASIVIGCSSTPVKEKIVYVPVKDTSDTTDIQRLVAAEHKVQLTKDSMQNVIDSLHSVNDSIGERLYIANYKLQRIKRYVDIVDSKPTQLKYLKGWIRRVIKDIK